jgi:hypothetical protein
MTLSINIDDPGAVVRTSQLLDAHFVFNGEYERCPLQLKYWTISDYVSQWISALSHVIDSRSPGALITSIVSPSVAVNLVAWVLYPLADGSVKIQQHFLMHDQFVRGREVIGYELLRPRRVVGDDGEKISEWTVSIDDLIDARRKLRHLEKWLPGQSEGDVKT